MRWGGEVGQTSQSHAVTQPKLTIHRRLTRTWERKVLAVDADRLGDESLALVGGLNKGGDGGIRARDNEVVGGCGGGSVEACDVRTPPYGDPQSTTSQEASEKFVWAHDGTELLYPRVVFA